MNEKEQLTPEQIASDKEQRELYEMAVLAKQALHRQKARSMTFGEKKTSRRSFSSIAAAVLAFMFISGIAYAAISISRGKFIFFPKNEPAAVIDSTSVSTDTVKSIPFPADSIPEEILFDNATLEEMMDTVAHHYNLKVDFRDEASRKIRIYYFFNKKKSVEKLIRDLNHFNKFEIKREEETLYIQLKPKK